MRRLAPALSAAPVSRPSCTGVPPSDEQEHALSTHAVIDDDDMHHLVSGLSLEVARQADRIRRRSQGQDWPGAASAMSELEEAVEVLGRIVNLTLRSSLAPPPEEMGEPEVEAEPTPALSTGQYL
jgi:hypothetical protein